MSILSHRKDAQSPPCYCPLAVGELIAGDVAGPISVKSRTCLQYISVFKDVHSKWTSVHCIKTPSSSAILSHLKEFIEFLRIQTGATVKRVRTDNASYYTSKAFNEFCTSEGIDHHLSVPYSSADNPDPERANRTILEAARTILTDSQPPRHLWPYAVNFAVYTQNRSPNSRFFSQSSGKGNVLYWKTAKIGF